MDFTYASLFSHLRRWFMSRGGDAIADNQAIMDYLNFTIQDIYNEDNATFTYVSETLTGVSNGDGKNNKFIAANEIRKIQLVYEVNDNGDLIRQLQPHVALLENDSVIFSGKNIIIDDAVSKILVVYIKEYNWAALTDMALPIPLPKRYIPSLLKLAYDWAAPINLMAGETATTDFYTHGITRLNKLVAEDSVTDFLDVKPR